MRRSTNVGRWRPVWLLPGLILTAALLAVACGGDDEEMAATRAPTSTTATRAPTSTIAPQAKTPPLIGGFYNDKPVTYLLTDISSQADATALSKATGYPVTFVPSLGQVPEASLTKLYLFMNGVKGPNPFGFQANVLDSVPGQPAYSPLWRVYAVKWAGGVTAKELKSEQDIVAAQSAGELTIEKTPLVKNSPVAAKTPPLTGGFYDGRAVNYFLTDISSEQDAKDLSKATGYPVTYVPQLGEVPESSLAKLYLFMNGVKGPNPFGFQANVLDSVPGQPAYSPLWRVYAVKWADGVTAKELRSEQDIVAAQSAGGLTIEKTPLVKNSPVIQ